MSHLNIFSFPVLSMENPYLYLFYNTLSKYNFHYSGGLNVNDDWLYKNFNKIDILHFHWPEDIWRVRSTNKIGRLRGVIGFWKYLRLANKLGIKIWWTVHNLEHHEGTDFVDKLGYRVLAKLSNLIICHSNYALNILKKRDYPRGKVVVMYHGIYKGVYPTPIPREEVLRNLDLDPCLPTFCCLGNIRYYKGFDLAVDAINSMKTKVQLIIAGKVHKDYNINMLSKKVSFNNRCKLIPKFLSKKEFSDIIAACDAVILPYRKITTSGLLLAAWSFDKPAIVSDHPYFRELVIGAEAAVVFFQPGNVADLAGAISKMISEDKISRLKAISKLKKRYSWENCIKSLLKNL